MRRLTEPRTRTAAITEKAKVPAARKTSNAISMVLLSCSMFPNTVIIVSMVRS